MSKKHYVVWLTTEETYKAYFDADSIEHARQIVADIKHGDISLEQPPEDIDLYLKSKEYLVAIDDELLEEIPNV